MYGPVARIWWNWQTRYFEVVVPQGMQVQVLLCAPLFPWFYPERLVRKRPVLLSHQGLLFPVDFGSFQHKTPCQLADHDPGAFDVPARPCGIRHTAWCRVHRHVVIDASVCRNRFPGDLARLAQ